MDNYSDEKAALKRASFHKCKYCGHMWSSSESLPRCPKCGKAIYK